MFILYAERETDRKMVATASSLREAANTVRMLEDHDQWPEGYDAIATAMGVRWAMVEEGSWQRLDPMVSA